MPKLRPATPAHRDEGAIAVVFALFMGSLVVVGMLALVVDVGQLYAEHEELQNGADAGALSAAHRCAQAHGEGCDLTELQNLARTAAEQNAKDGAAEATLRCIRVNGAMPLECPLDDLPLTGCVGPRPSTGDFVEIRTITRTADGRTLLPPSFGAAVLGRSYQGTQVYACARAGWGALASHPRVFGLGIDECLWNALVSDPQGPGLVTLEQARAEPPDPARESELRGQVCAPAQDPRPGTDPDVLAWFGSPGGDCFQELRAGTEVPGGPVAPGGAVATCRLDGRETTPAAFLDTTSEPVILPVYRTPSPDAGENRTYHIVGFAYFLPTGYRLDAHNARPSSTGRDCGGEDAEASGPCVIGFFVQGTVFGAPGPGEGYGLKAVQLIG